MNATEFKRWLNAQLQVIEPHIGEPPTPVFAETVATAKAYAYLLGLHDFALSLPDNELGKTPLTAANQLRRCLAALEAPPCPDTITPPELAGILGVSADTVLEWIRSSELKASNLNKPGKRPRYVIAKDDLNEFLKRRQPEPKPTKRRKRQPKDDVMEFFR